MRLLAAVSILVAGTAAAQQPDSTRADSARTLAPVTVRALRAVTAAAAAPWAVTVKERDAAERARAGLSLDEPLRGIPGLQVDDRHNWALGERMSIRGFGARAQFGVRGLKVLVDGVPATMPDGQTTLNHVDVRSVRRAEVVRGAASSLYGNAAGGVILLETAPPPIVPFDASAGAAAGAYGLRRAWADAGGRAGAAAWSASVSRLGASGYRAHADATNTWVLARGVLEGAQGAASLVFTAVDYDASNPGSLSDSLLRVDRRMAFSGNVAQNTGEAGRHEQLGASLRRRVGRAEVELVPYVLHRKLDNPIPGRVIALDRAAGGARLVARAAEDAASRLWWSAGAETDLQRDDRQNYANASGARGALVLDQLERVGTRALFAQLGAAPVERVRATAGLRYDRARFRASDRLITGTNPDDSGERTMSAVSPSFGASLRLGGGMHAYANASTAFETPTTTELANRPTGAGGFNPELEPQRSVSVEAGVRGDAGGALRWEASVYQARVRDALVPFEVAGSPGRQFFRNAGHVVHRGAELGAQWRPMRDWRVDGSYSFTDARFDRYQVGAASYDGNRLPGVAPSRGDLAVTWARPAGPFAAVEGRAASSMSVNDAGAAHSPAYAVVDVRAGAAGVRLAGARATLYAGLSNLLDRRYNASVVINAFGGRYYEPAPGRAAFIGASLDLGRAAP